MASFTDYIKQHLNSVYRGANIIEYNDGGIEVYVSFQLLLKFISENLNLVTNNDKEIVSIDWQSDKPFYALSCHISTDLKTCYLYNDKLKIEDGSNPNPEIATFHPFTYFTNDDFKVVNANLRSESGATSEDFVYPQVGNINYIYLNVGYLSNIISSNLDKDNKITLRNFLQTVCDDLNKSLGGINDFQVVINADSNNILTIVDFNQSRIKGLVSTIEGSTKFSVIQAQGTGIDNGNRASFVRSIQAQSNITSDMASAISIGAQANGNQLGIEATQFSRLSKGLTDRIYPEKYIINTEGSVISINDKFKTNIESFKKLIQNLQNNPSNPGGAKINLSLSDENNNGPIITDLFKAMVGEFTDKNLSNPTFIPIKLELELLGISGIRIFEQFELSSDVLPLSYKNDFNFIITGVSHEISIHKWITKLAAYTYLKDIPSSTSKTIQAVNLNLSSPSNTTTTSSPTKLYKGSTISTLDETVSFLTDVLKGLGISNPNNNQIAFIKMWRQHEGAEASWNPFNTTLSKPGSLPYNSVHVQNYPDRQTGLQATIETLSLFYYTDVIKAIKNIKPGNDTASKNTINTVMEAINKSPWGSKFIPADWRSWGTLNNLLAKDPIISR